MLFSFPLSPTHFFFANCLFWDRSWTVLQEYWGHDWLSAMYLVEALLALLYTTDLPGKGIIIGHNIFYLLNKHLNLYIFISSKRPNPNFTNEIANLWRKDYIVVSIFFSSIQKQPGFVVTKAFSRGSQKWKKKFRKKSW